MLKKQLDIFLTALMFYTRIPCHITIPHSPDLLNKASRYFPLIGWIVGMVSAVVFILASWLFGIEVAVILSIITGVWITGAFHEDGLADCADGFGGGWEKQRILDIMKDSRVGAFGLIATVLSLLLKFTVLAELMTLINNNGIYESHQTKASCFITLVFISYHALARLTAIHVAFISYYARDDATSKVKPIAKTHGTTEILGAYFFGLLPLGLLSLLQWQIILCLIPLACTCLYSKYYFEKWLDGYTGDCLGAVEQVAEVLCLLSFLAILRLSW